MRPNQTPPITVDQSRDTREVFVLAALNAMLAQTHLDLALPTAERWR